MKARTFLKPEFWPQAEKLCYFVLLPALFINGTATTELGDLPIGMMAPVLAGSVIVTAMALILVQRRFRFDGPAFTSVVQGSIRFNNYLGLSIAVILYGEQGVALAAFTTAILVPLVNVLCTIVFARHGSRPLSVKGTLRSIGTNPLILACAAGIVLNLTGVGLPAGIVELVRALGSASLPLGLLCVGAGLQSTASGGMFSPSPTRPQSNSSYCRQSPSQDACFWGWPGRRRASWSSSWPFPQHPRRTSWPRH